MGLLDDAIREHLELKRRHGADPDEVTRQEREALGAPRARRVRAAGRRGAPRPAASPRPAEPPEPEPEPAPAPAASPRRRAGRMPETEPSPSSGARPSRRTPEPGAEEDPWLVEDSRTPSRRPAGARRDPPPPRAPAEGEDVLEETPEFLQETPEHDRLWFEQKPPRDFDWDK